MTDLLVDTSVVLKWFHRHGEKEVGAARSLLQAHQERRVRVLVLDLAMYELGNVLSRALGWAAEDVADQLDDLETIVGEPLVLAAAWRWWAATLARSYGLTFYDAAWAATATELDVPFVTADHQLLVAGLAESPTAVVGGLRLPAQPG